MQYRTEHDTIGEIQVPADRLWGAQTQRSLHNFSISNEIMPLALIYAFARLKMACARVNHSLGKLDADRKDLIVQVCNEILAGTHDKEFPLVVWQTGSGTQTNMNVNEVIANRGAQIRAPKVDNLSLHPNDHVNMSQSSNDTFPSTMHIAAVHAIEESLFPVLDEFAELLMEKADRFKDIVKIGRTHLQDATPLTLGQEISGWTAMITASRQQIESSLPYLRTLAIGGTAVGTGLNAPAGFGHAVAADLSKNSGTAFTSSSNHFHGLTSHDALVMASGAVKGLAANMMKIANDIRWLASGPRCGIGEITIPANEPGSSIMPGKVNPTQAEAVTMAACQIFGNDATIGFAASQGNFELNVFKPVIIYNFLQSVTLMSDAVKSFGKNCVAGLEPDRDNIARNLHNSLMLVTALNPHVGYENAAKIAKKAHQEKSSLKEAAVSLNLLSEEEFDRLVAPEKMTNQE